MIPGVHDLGLFIVSGLLLNVTPGADTLYIVGRSTLQGRTAGAVAALGIGAGCLVHTFAAAVGLSAILATSAAAFAVVKWVGAAYLVWLGIGLLRANAPARRDGPARLREARLARVFLQGLLTNVLNPKVALFFLAFLPQFIDASAPSKALAFVALGLIFNVNGTLWNLVVAWMAASAARRFGGGQATTWLGRIAGTLFVYLGVRLALVERA
jgi:threonine/homoserine/homoserine lactone efflux protein